MRGGAEDFASGVPVGRVAAMRAFFEDGRGGEMHFSTEGEDTLVLGSGGDGGSQASVGVNSICAHVAVQTTAWTQHKWEVSMGCEVASGIGVAMDHTLIDGSGEYVSNDCAGGMASALTLWSATAWAAWASVWTTRDAHDAQKATARPSTTSGWARCRALAMSRSSTTTLSGSTSPLRCNGGTSSTVASLLPADGDKAVARGRSRFVLTFTAPDKIYFNLL